MLLILGAVSLGCLVGAPHLVPPAALPWVDRLMAAGLTVLLFSMGVPPEGGLRADDPGADGCAVQNHGRRLRPWLYQENRS